MRTFEKVAAQGDLLIERIDALPEGLIPSTAKDGRFIVAHSETGHHHAMDAGTCAVLDDPKDPFTSYAVVTAPTEIQHERPFDTHEGLMVDEGTFILRRQREYTPEGMQRVAD